MIGPSTLDSPNTAPNRPPNLARSRGGNRSAITEKAPVNSAPPPMPWMARNTISCIMPPPISGSGPNSPASPHSTEPAMNTPIPLTRIGLRP